MGRGSFRKTTRESQRELREKKRLEEGPPKYIARKSGSVRTKRTINPEWTKWNKDKQDKKQQEEDAKTLQEQRKNLVKRENRQPGESYYRTKEKSDIDVDSMKKYSSKPDDSNKRQDYYTGGKEKTGSDYADEAARTSTELKIGKEDSSSSSNSAQKAKDAQTYTKQEKAGSRQSSARNLSLIHI